MLAMARVSGITPLRMPSCRVDHRRIVENKMPFPHGGAVVVDKGDRAANEGLGQLAGVGNGGAAQDKLRMAAIKFAQAHETPQHIGQVGTEYATVSVNFINDNVAQVFKELDPLGVVGKNAAVQHVRIGDHNVARLAHSTPSRAGRVSIVGVGLDVHAHGLDELVQFADLVRGQGLGGKR